MKRIIACLLLTIMLLQMCACSVTPAEKNPKNADTETAPKNTTEETRTPHQVPKLDFEGETFTAAFIGHYSGSCNNGLYFAAEESSDNMEAAVFRRTEKVKEYLNVGIVYVEEVKSEEYQNLFKAGDDLYQLLMLSIPDENRYQEDMLWTAYIIKPYVAQGLLYNFDELPYVDYTADWWNKEQMDVLRLGKRTCLGVSDFSITHPAAIVFNKDIVEDNNLESPYDLVYSGKWTLDKFIELAASVINDVNGDGLYGDEDVAGLLIGDQTQLTSFFPGCGQFITQKNENGRVELALNTEKTLSLYDTLSTIAETAGLSYYVDVDKQQAQYEKGNYLFMPGFASTMEDMTNTEFDVGIVPFPKYNEEQKEYMSLAWGGMMGVSGIIRNPEMVGAVLELLSWESKNQVVPTYYDVLLKTRYAHDPETRDMMDILFDSIVYEVVAAYFSMSPGLCELFYSAIQPARYGQRNFAAFYRAYKTPANNQLKEFYELLDKTENASENTEE